MIAKVGNKNFSLKAWYLSLLCLLPKDSGAFKNTSIATFLLQKCLLHATIPALLAHMDIKAVNFAGMTAKQKPFNKNFLKIIILLLG